MSLAPGTKLGPYEIVAPLGSGGMGDVYRARDARLARDVAIKALPPAFAQDPERLARFEREAKLLASLNHPNIAGILGLEEADGARYLVLELIEGETLADRLMRGPLPLDDALDVAKHVAAGVEAAHESAVVHRDLKPGNIMITPAGVVKVLDFGLAKGASSGRTGSDPNLSASPTMTHAATAAGVILGTAAYMSPEQARGKTVDRRTDIWSFGCVLYECLSGKRAYDGETVSDMVARILEREPDWSALPANTPPRLLALLKRCLVKDARLRQRDLGDARLELDAIARGETNADVSATAPVKARSGVPVWSLAVAILAALLALTQLVMQQNVSPPPATLSLEPPPGVTMNEEPTESAISPDGTQAVFVASDTLAGARLWLRSLARDDSRGLEHTEDPTQPFWSPDGKRIGFFAHGKLCAITLATGAVRELAVAPLGRGGAWGKGMIVYQPRSVGPLMKIPEAGGEPVVATEVDSAKGDLGHRFPCMLPDGRQFVFSVLSKGEGTIALGSLDGTKSKPVTHADDGAVYAAPSYLLFAKSGGLRALRFDAGSGRVSGAMLDVPGLLPIHPASVGGPLVSASRTGVLLQRGAASTPRHLVLVDRQGHVVAEPPVAARYYDKGMLSADARHLAIEYSAAVDGDHQIGWIDLERGTLQPLTFDQYNESPAISPDGQEVVFTRDLAGSSSEVWTMRIDAPSSMRSRYVTGNAFSTVLDYSPDGKGVLYRAQGTDTQQDLYYVTLGDSAHARPLLATRFNEPTGAISPDGHSLAYLSDESGHFEVLARSFPELTGQQTVSSHGAYTTATGSTRLGRPHWRRDGRELIYIAPDERTVMSVAVTPGAPPHFAEPVRLFRVPAGLHDMIISADHERFVYVQGDLESARRGATVIQHWTGLLEGAK